MTVELVTIKDVELARTGLHHLKTGDTILTRDDLQAAIDATTSDPAVVPPRAKLAHEKVYDTGEPSFGVAANLRLRDDPDGQATVIGDWVGCPKWLAEVAPTALPNRSIEGERDWTSGSGKTHRLVIGAFGLLGVKMPGIKGLKDLATWYGPAMPDGVVLAAYGDALKADPKETIVPYPKAMLDKLGLPEDAADDAVLAKLDALDAAAKGDPDAIKAKVDEAVAAAAEQAKKDAETAAAADAQKQIDEARTAAQDAALADLKTKGLTVVDAEALQKLQADATAGATLAAAEADKSIVAEIEAAIGEGAIAPARKDDYVKARKEGSITAETVAALPRNVVPVDQRGTAADPLEASQGESAVPLGWYTDGEVARLQAAGRLPKS